MIRHYLIKAIFLALLILNTSSAMAISCKLNFGVETHTLSFSPDTIAVPVDTPHGKVIASASTGIWRGGADLWGCTTAWYNDWIMQSFTVKSEINNVYKTNISGIGIKITDVPNNAVANSHKSMAANQFIDIGGIGIVADLIRIDGELGTGPLTGGIVANAQIPGYDGPQGIDVAHLTLSPTVYISVATCNADTAGLSFPIGNIPKNSFGTSVGYIPPSSKNTQNLNINCDGVANAMIELQAAQNPDVSSNNTVIAVDGQGTAGVASGVGVQMIYNGQTPLQINTPLSIKKLTNGTQALPFVAQYYQTKSAVTAGSANATFTLKITYQ